MTQPALTRDPETDASPVEVPDTDVAATAELPQIGHDAEGQLAGIEIVTAAPSLLASIPAWPDTRMLRDLLKPHAA